MNLFGRKKTAPAAAAPAAPASVRTEDAIAHLSATQEKLQKRKDYLEQLVKKTTAQAIELNKRGDKKGAVLMLKTKKNYDAELTKLAAMWSNLENMKGAATSNAMNQDFVQAAQVGTGLLKAQQQLVSPEAVDEMRDQFEEVMDNQAQMNEALSSVWGPQGVEDDSELLDQLAELEADQLQGELTAPPRGVAAPAAAAPAAAATPATAPLPHMPSVPSTAPVVPAAAHTASRSMLDELAALEA